MTIDEILSKLRIIEARFVKGVKDNMRIEQIHLRLFPDGSGMVDAEWSKYRESMCREEKLLHSIFSVDSPILEFSSLKELEQWLIEMTP